jgi:hypothetical protein
VAFSVVFLPSSSTFTSSLRLYRTSFFHAPVCQQLQKQQQHRMKVLILMLFDRCFIAVIGTWTTFILLFVVKQKIVWKMFITSIQSSLSLATSIFDFIREQQKRATNEWEKGKNSKSIKKLSLDHFFCCRCSLAFVPQYKIRSLSVNNGHLSLHLAKEQHWERNFLLQSNQHSFFLFTRLACSTFIRLRKKLFLLNKKVNLNFLRATNCLLISCWC